MIQKCDFEGRTRYGHAGVTSGEGSGSLAVILGAIAVFAAAITCGCAGPTAPSGTDAAVPANSTSSPTATALGSGATVGNARLVATYRHPDARDIEWLLYEGEATGLSAPGITLFCRSFPPEASATCSGIPSESNVVFVGITRGYSGAAEARGPAYDPDQGCRLTSGITDRSTAIRHHEWGHVYQIVSGRIRRSEEEAHCFGAEVTRWAVGGLGYTAVLPALNHLWEAFDAVGVVVYRYSGNRFTHFTCGQSTPAGQTLCPNPAPGQSSYTTSDSVSMTLTLRQRLPPNLLLASIAVVTELRYTLSGTDGHQSLSLEGDRFSTLLVSTDAVGNIIAPWWVGIRNSANQRVSIYTANSQPHNLIADHADLGPSDSGTVFNSPGQWTVSGGP